MSNIPKKDRLYLPNQSAKSKAQDRELDDHIKVNDAETEALTMSKQHNKWGAKCLLYIFKKLGGIKGLDFMKRCHLHTSHELIKHFNIPVKLSTVPDRLFVYYMDTCTLMAGGDRNNEEAFNMIKDHVDRTVYRNTDDKVFHDSIFNPVTAIKALFNSKLSDLEISKRTGIPQPTITRYHNGSRDIKHMNITIGGKLEQLYRTIKMDKFKDNYENLNHLQNLDFGHTHVNFKKM